MFKLKSTFLTLSLAALVSTQLFANTENENVDLTSDTATTLEEIAAIQVLAEICPKIIGDNKNFDAGYQRILTDLLPGVSDPVNAVKAYASEPEFQTLMQQAREDAGRATAENNREVCLDVIDW